MAATRNSFDRKITSVREKSVELDKQLAKIEDDIRKLKIDFDIYFNGATKRPPFEARARLEATLKRIADQRGMSYPQRYLYSTLMSTYTSYRELWRRTLRARGEDLI